MLEKSKKTEKMTNSSIWRKIDITWKPINGMHDYTLAMKRPILEYQKYIFKKEEKRVRSNSFSE